MLPSVDSLVALSGTRILLISGVPDLSGVTGLMVAPRAPANPFSVKQVLALKIWTLLIVKLRGPGSFLCLILGDSFLQNGPM
jgi:hypothetical protein